MEMKREEKKSLKEFQYQMKGINEKDWHYLAHTKIQYTDKTTTIEEYTFEEMYDKIANTTEFDIYPVYVNTTLFTKKKRICFYDCFSSALTQEKMGNKVQFRIKAIDRTCASMQTLMAEMYQEDFIEYLKDQGIKCPLIK